jgi:ABC-type nitrate/sulfonate/bicarbonate transport system permease component
MALKIADQVKRYFKSWVKNESAKIVFAFIAIAAFIIVWHLASLFFNTPYLPSPLSVWEALINSFQVPDPTTGVDMWQNIRASLYRFLAGFIFALAIAVPLGLVLGYSKYAGYLGNPIVEIFRPIPPIAWVPFFFVVLGIVWGPIMAIFMGVFFPVLSNVIFGVKSVEPPLIDAARTLGSSRSDVFAKVVFPYTVPFMMTGIRIGVGIGWMCIVAAEMIGAKGGGVGLYILNQANIGRYENMFAGMVVIAILGLLSVEVAGYIERYTAKKMGARK